MLPKPLDRRRPTSLKSASSPSFHAIFGNSSERQKTSSNINRHKADIARLALVVADRMVKRTFMSGFAFQYLRNRTLFFH